MKKIKPGTILVHAIGCGCYSYYQVTKASACSVVVRRIEARVVKRSIKWQTMETLPARGKFMPDHAPQRLRIAADGRIGPIKRLQWWSVHDGKPDEHYSS